MAVTRVEVDRYTAEQCYRVIGDFDALLSEAEKLKSQRDECKGTSVELRRAMKGMNKDMLDAQRQRNSLQVRLDAEIANRPKRLTWFAVGGVTGIVVTVTTIILLNGL